MKKHLLTSLLAIAPAFFLAQSKVLLKENFETGTIPSSWTIKQTNEAEEWQVAYRETRVAEINNDWMEEPQDEWLISPSLDFSASAHYSLSADVGMSYTWGVSPYDNYDVLIKISTDNGISWKQLWSEDELGVFTDWKMNTINLDLSDYQGNPNVKIAFQYVGTDGASAMIDNIAVRAVQHSPACVTLGHPSANASEVPFKALTLRWNMTADDDADLFDVYLDTNPNPTTLRGTTGKTTLNAFNLQPSTKYYWKVVPKNTVGSSQNCAVQSFTTAATDYCVAQALVPRFGKINRVLFGNIDNPSVSAAGYEDFTSVEGNMFIGENTTFTAESDYTNEDSRLMVWIDYNQDGVFEAEEERVLDIQEGSPWTGEIIAPENAKRGKTRMRVRLIDMTQTSENIVNSTPCGNSGYGQVEDYTVNISDKLGTTEISQDDFKIYPNPVKDVLHIENSSKINEVQILDISGKTRSAHKSSGSKIHLDLSKLIPGTYLLRIIQDDKTVKTRKIIKK